MIFSSEFIHGLLSHGYYVLPTSHPLLVYKLDDRKDLYLQCRYRASHCLSSIFTITRIQSAGKGMHVPILRSDRPWYCSTRGQML